LCLSQQSPPAPLLAACLCPEQHLQGPWACSKKGGPPTHTAVGSI
jgi:hypothetical protein